MFIIDTANKIEPRPRAAETNGAAFEHFFLRHLTVTSGRGIRVLTLPAYFYIIGNMKSTQAVVALEALAQESRLGIFRLLVEAGKEGLPAGNIAKRMGLPAATLSFHLSQLKHAGLTACLRRGTSLIYSADFDAMNALVGFLTENCCGAGASCAPACGVPQPTKRRSKTK